MRSEMPEVRSGNRIEPYALLTSSKSEHADETPRSSTRAIRARILDPRPSPLDGEGWPKAGVRARGIARQQRTAVAS